MERVLQPEWLDTLEPQDARAQRSRTDLRRINAIMGSARHIARILDRHDPLRIADLGAGDGRLMLKVAQRLRRPGVELCLVDRAPAVVDADLQRFSELQWTTEVISEDALRFLEHTPRFDAIVANLFLHHFEDAALARLLELAAARTMVFIACEPRRGRLALAASRLLWLLRCNDVTQHDAVISVRAGFRDRELSALWPSRRGWTLRESGALPFSHLFVACRDA